MRHNVPTEKLLEEIEALKHERDDLKLLLNAVTAHSDGVEADLLDRTEELSEVNQQLQQAKEELEAQNTKLESANTELKDFAHIVSHDLKAPLRGINQIAQWLVQDYSDTVDAQGREMLQLLVGGVEHLKNLINGVLYYSKAGRIHEHEEELDLNLLLKESCGMLAVPDHIQIVIKRDLPLVTGNKTCFEHIFQNLLSNALKFLDKPEGLITIDVADERAHWLFSVTDNGPGIAPQHQEKIFSIFYTAATPDESKSTGVGLSIVKKLVGACGGKVWVESQPKEGSIFFFTIPKS